MTNANGGPGLLPWVLGLIVVAIVEIYLASVFFGPSCQAPAIAQFMVLIAIPGVYLPLMYLTLKSGSGQAG